MWERVESACNEETGEVHHIRRVIVEADHRCVAEARGSQAANRGDAVGCRLQFNGSSHAPLDLLQHELHP